MCYGYDLELLIELLSHLSIRFLSFVDLKEKDQLIAAVFSVLFSWFISAVIKYPSIKF